MCVYVILVEIYLEFIDLNYFPGHDDGVVAKIPRNSKMRARLFARGHLSVGCKSNPKRRMLMLESVLLREVESEGQHYRNGDLKFIF